MILINVLLAWLLATICTCGIPKKDLDPLEGEPLACWRKAIFKIVLVQIRFQLFLMGFWWISVKGQRASRNEAPIIVANHVSGLVEGMVFMRCAKLAERKNVENMVIAPFMKATESILIDRESTNSKTMAKDALLRRSKDDRFPQTLVFPEGTTTNGTALITFKMGAFSPGVPMQPVCFRYGRCCGSGDHSFTQGVKSRLWQMIDCILLTPGNPIEVEYLPVYRPSEAEIKNPILYANNVQKVIASALGIPITQHATEDILLCMKAQEKGLPGDVGVVRWQAVKEQLSGLDLKQAMNVLDDFQRHDESGRGHLDYKAFVHMIREREAVLEKDAGPAEGAGGAGAAGFSELLPSEPNPARAERLCDKEMRSIFRLMDRNGDGWVDFEEYLCGVAVFSGMGKEDEGASLKWMFDSLACGKDYFTKEELTELLLRVAPALSTDRLDELFEEADASGDGVVSRKEFIAFALKHRAGGDFFEEPELMIKGMPTCGKIKCEIEMMKAKKSEAG